MTSDNIDKLKEAVLLCSIHYERMSFAWEKINGYFPFDSNKYLSLKPEELSFIDQLIFRFSKLQDSMGGRLFPAILEALGEEIKERPFIDRLARLEELNVIPGADEWMVLRETRNVITHEYPFVTNEVIDGLNLLGNHYHLIRQIWQQVQNYVQGRLVT